MSFERLSDSHDGSELCCYQYSFVIDSFFGVIVGRCSGDWGGDYIYLCHSHYFGNFIVPYTTPETVMFSLMFLMSMKLDNACDYLPPICDSAPISSFDQ